MINAVFAFLTSAIFLIIAYAFEVFIPYSYFLYILYGVCIFMVSTLTGIKFYRYRCEKQGKQWSKISVPLIFSKEKNVTHEESSKMQIATSVLTPVVRILFLVMVWNVASIFLPSRVIYMVEFTFLSILDNITNFVQELVFEYSRTRITPTFAFSDYISMFGLHGILLIWESYFFSHYYNKFFILKS